MAASADSMWHPEAIEDAEGARNWYAERNPLAARGFLLALEAAVAAISAAPERWPVGRHGCRRYVFPRGYPYIVVYRISTDLEILAVEPVGQRQREARWEQRVLDRLATALHRPLHQVDIDVTVLVVVE